MDLFWLAMLDFAVRVGSYISGVNSTRETNATNLQIARETNEAQTEIHKEDNAFNAAEAEKAREYNSIGSQLERGREAGVSDWFTLGQPSTTATSASASNMPGFAVPQMQNPFAQIGASPLDLTGSLKNLADAKKAGAETTEIETLLGLKVDQAKENLIRDRLQNELTRLYGAGIQQATLDRICADTAHLEALAREAHANADFTLERKVLTQLEQVTERYKSKLTRTQYKLANEDLKSYRERLEADLRVKDSEAGRNKAQATESYSVAQLNREMATRVRELLPGEKEQQKLSQKLMKAETQLTWEQIRTEPEKRHLMAQQCVQMYEETKGIRMDNEQKRIYTDKFEDIINTALHADKAALNQIIQDYNNPFRYIGHVFGGSGAAAVNAVSGHRPGPVKVSGFR